MAKDKMTPIRWEIVQALANNRMRVSEAARALHMDRSTVLYHLGMIKAITGKDPMNFYDLVDLVWMSEEAP